MSLSPLQYSRAVLVNERLVVGLQLLDVRQLGGLGVKVEFAVQRTEGVASGHSSEEDH